ncbi:MAG: hypothetical protein ACI8RD_014119 [Bacillariaceae sp.]|jgi:hypothetical protein
MEKIQDKKYKKGEYQFYGENNYSGSRHVLYEVNCSEIWVYNEHHG